MNQSTDIGVTAYNPATYLNYQFNKFDPKMYFGLGINAPFGLKTEPDKAWAGSTVSGSSRLFTLNFNPTLGYKLSAALSVGVGAQLQIAKGVFKFATGSPTGPSTYYEGNSIAAGVTAGLMYTPSPATRIGLGYSSQMTHELDGTFNTDKAFSGGLFSSGVNSKVELRLPDMVNLSIQQAVTTNARVLATVEWAGWSRFGGLEVIANGPGNVVTKGAPTALGNVASGGSIARIEGDWDVGWFFSAGVEYDVSKALTVRAGGAYEILPITKASQRISSIPDADRIWASFGLSYAMNEKTTIDFGYSHVFVKEVQVDRFNVTGTNRIIADLDASVDILSLGVRMKLH